MARDMVIFLIAGGGRAGWDSAWVVTAARGRVVRSGAMSPNFSLGTIGPYSRRMTATRLNPAAYPRRRRPARKSLSTRPSPAKIDSSAALTGRPRQAHVGPGHARGPAAPSAPGPHRAGDRVQPRIEVRQEAGRDGQARPHTPEPVRIVPAIMTVALVVLRPERRIGRHRDQEVGPRGRRGEELGEEREIIGDVLEDVHQQDEAGLPHHAAQVAGRAAADEPASREAGTRQLDRLARRVDAHARVIRRHRGDVGTRAAADVDDQRTSRGGRTCRDQAPARSAGGRRTTSANPRPVRGAETVPISWAVSRQDRSGLPA